MNIKKSILKIKKDTKGAVAIEYGLIIALIAVAIIAGVSNFSQSTTNMYNHITNNISNATAR